MVARVPTYARDHLHETEYYYAYHVIIKCLEDTAVRMTVGPRDWPFVQ